MPVNEEFPRGRPKPKVLQDRAKISEMYIKGMSQAQIAEAVGISQATVSRDLKAIQEAWRQTALMNFGEAKARELARIDEIEREAWEAWKRSLSPREISSSKRVAPTATPGQPTPNPTRTEAGVRKETSTGNPAFLATVQWCVEQRCKIFGIYAPTRFRVEDLDSLIEKELVRLAGQAPAVDEDAALEETAPASEYSN